LFSVAQDDTPLDVESQRRCTTVYLVNMVLPMLPPLLCEQLCSLNPYVDRLAYSCVWRMRADGTLVEPSAKGKDGADPNPWFGRTVISSCCKLDYQTAQRMITGEITPEAADRAPSGKAGDVGGVPAEQWCPMRRPTYKADGVSAARDWKCSDVVKDVVAMDRWVDGWADGWAGGWAASPMRRPLILPSQHCQGEARRANAQRRAAAAQAQAGVWPGRGRQP
jgi:hypothetical protein